MLSCKRFVDHFRWVDVKNCWGGEGGQQLKRYVFKAKLVSKVKFQPLVNTIILLEESKIFIFYSGYSLVRLKLRQLQLSRGLGT